LQSILHGATALPFRTSQWNRLRSYAQFGGNVFVLQAIGRTQDNARTLDNASR
jgi:hypothetical protein